MVKTSSRVASNSGAQAQFVQGVYCQEWTQDMKVVQMIIPINTARKNGRTICRGLKTTGEGPDEDVTAWTHMPWPRT